MAATTVTSKAARNAQTIKAGRIILSSALAGSETGPEVPLRGFRGSLNKGVCSEISDSSIWFEDDSK